jgi:hypothetical protein
MRRRQRCEMRVGEMGEGKHRVCRGAIPIKGTTLSGSPGLALRVAQQ